MHVPGGDSSGRFYPGHGRSLYPLCSEVRSVGNTVIVPSMKDGRLRTY